MSDSFNIDDLAGLSDEDFQSKVAEANISAVEESQEILNEQTGEEEAEVEEETLEAASTESEATLEEGLDGEEETEEGESEENDDTSEEPDVSENTNAQELLDKLFSPFNANGTQIKVDSVEEAIELMQMGANYHKKMGILKPNLRYLKTLEKEGLLDEDKINLMVEVSKGNKQAISKLLSSVEVNPLDLDTEDKEYKPGNHTVSQEAMNLDEAIESIRDTETFKDTMELVTGQWDKASQGVLVANPQRLLDLNAHMASGLYSRINAEVQKQRMFGRLDQNLSDIEAYERVGLELMRTEQANANRKPVDVPNKAKNNANEKAAQRRKVAPPKAANKAGVDESLSLDALAKLSDEDFKKVSKKYF